MDTTEKIDISQQELGSIKKPGETEFVSAEENQRRILEIAKCKRDICYFAEKYFKIINMATGLQTIKLYPKQKQLLNHLIDNDRSVILASRQTGKTTSYTIFCLWLTTFYLQKKIMICANKLQTAIEIMDRIRLAYEYLPRWIKGTIAIYNKAEITFTNKSSIRAFSTSSSASRGFSGNCVDGDTIVTIRRKILPFLHKKIKIRELVQHKYSKLASLCSTNLFQEDLHRTMNCRLSEKISRRYGEVRSSSGWQIKTDGGWEDIKAVAVGFNAKLLQLRTEKGNQLLCTPKHILIGENGEELLAEESENRLVVTSEGLQRVVECVNYPGYGNVYDLSLSNTHTYYSNGILSHNCVICDEIAFVPKNIVSDFFASVMPIISSAKNSKAILVSTPNGTDNMFYEIWQKANSREREHNREGWKPFRIDWFEVPGRTEEWKEQQIQTIGIERWRQEFGNEFLSSGFNKLIEDSILDKFRMKLSDWKAQEKEQGAEIRLVSKDGRKVYAFTMWRRFRPDRTYVASADVTEGTGSDSSVLQIWDVTDTSNITQCAEFSQTKISTIEFAYVIRKICELYCDPYLIMEQNGIGQAVLEQLNVTYEYPALVRLGKDGTYGVRSHVSVKTKACLWLRDMMTTEGFGWTIFSRRTVEEMSTFVKKDTVQHTVYAALTNSHDDHIMTLIWAAWMLNEEHIDRYFVVADTFVSSLDKILPKNIQPQYEYSQNEIAKAEHSELMFQFETYEQENQKKFKTISDRQIAERTGGKEPPRKETVQTKPDTPKPQPAVDGKKEVIDLSDPRALRQEQHEPFGFYGNANRQYERYGGMDRNGFDWGDGGGSWN